MPWMLALLLLVGSMPAWATPASALDQGAGQALARVRLHDEAAAALFARFAKLGPGLELRPLAEAEGELQVPAGKLTLQARVPEGALLSRRMAVYVELKVDGRFWRLLPVWFAVQAWRPVWVARAPLAAGHEASAEAFTSERREVTAMASPALPATQPLDGLRLRQPMAAGAVLTAALVEARPAVARQQPVQVRVQAGPVELWTQGVALTDARIGEVVRVLNPSSQQSYAARVLADGLVEAGTR